MDGGYRWLPAVNSLHEVRGWDRWDFLEIATEEELGDLRKVAIEKLKS